MARTARLVDWRIAGVVAAVAVFGASVGPAPAGGRWLVIAHGLLHAAPLLVHRARPVAALAGTTTVVVAGALAELGSVGSELGPLVAAYAVGAYSPPSRHAAVALSAFASALVGAAPALGAGGGDPGTLERVLSAAAVFGIALLLGRVVRGRRDLAEQRTVQTLRDERARIARELHDVVAHHVGAMVIQAGAARRVLNRDPGRAREALEDIERAGREALEAMPALLGALRHATDPAAADASELAPAASMAALPELVERTRRLGLSVDLTVRGEPGALPPGVDVSAYRVVQEALTNAAKHAGPARVDVLVSYELRELTVVVEDDGRGAPEGGAAGGHGLLGMRERATLLGGVLEAGPRPGGGFRVEARFPLEAR